MIRDPQCATWKRHAKRTRRVVRAARAAGMHTGPRPRAEEGTRPRAGSLAPCSAQPLYLNPLSGSSQMQAERLLLHQAARAGREQVFFV